MVIDVVFPEIKHRIFANGLHPCPFTNMDEQDAGFHSAARRTLDEGQAYISMPMQQKVMEKVCEAFGSKTKLRDVLSESTK